MGSVLSVVVVLLVLAVVAAVALLTLRTWRRTHDEPAADPVDPDLGTGGWHGPSASGGFPAVDPDRREPIVPTQRTGDHDRDETHATPARRPPRRNG